MQGGEKKEGQKKGKRIASRKGHKGRGREENGKGVKLV